MTAHVEKLSLRRRCFSSVAKSPLRRPNGDSGCERISMMYSLRANATHLNATVSISSFLAPSFFQRPSIGQKRSPRIHPTQYKLRNVGSSSLVEREIMSAPCWITLGAQRVGVHTLARTSRFVLSPVLVSIASAYPDHRRALELSQRYGRLVKEVVMISFQSRNVPRAGRTLRSSELGWKSIASRV